jgi:hypothetical protein
MKLSLCAIDVLPAEIKETERVEDGEIGIRLHGPCIEFFRFSRMRVFHS